MESKVWADQRDFNHQLRPTDAVTYEERTAWTKEFVLHLMSECAELLNAAGSWKSNRKELRPENRAQVLTELTDIYKFWITIAQTWGFTEQECEAAYWRKSAAVRQRFTEEFLRTLDAPVVILDLDSVLCNYALGLAQWIRTSPWKDHIDPARIDHIATGTVWITADALGVSERVWGGLKHAFRTSGAKRSLPVYDGAAAFTVWCQDQMGYQVIILTSRPIDLYPTLYEDTVEWLNTHHIAYTRVWWGTDKAKKLADSHILEKVHFAVDDDFQYVSQYVRAGVLSYWMTPDLEQRVTSRVIPVRSFTDIIEAERTRYGNPD